MTSLSPSRTILGARRISDHQSVPWEFFNSPDKEHIQLLYLEIPLNYDFLSFMTAAHDDLLSGFLVHSRCSQWRYTLRKKVLQSTFFWCLRLSQIEDSIQYLGGPNSIWKDHDRNLGVQVVVYLWQPEAPKKVLWSTFFLRVYVFLMSNRSQKLLTGQDINLTFTS